jgi:hypothetical protein
VVHAYAANFPDKDIRTWEFGRARSKRPTGGSKANKVTELEPSCWPFRDRGTSESSCWHQDIDAAKVYESHVIEGSVITEYTTSAASQTLCCAGGKIESMCHATNVVSNISVLQMLLNVPKEFPLSINRQDDRAIAYASKSTGRVVVLL